MTRFPASLFLFVLPFLILTATTTDAGECTYGTVKAWFRGSQGEWVNATAHPLFHRGESFEIKLSITSVTALRVVYVKLHEFGTPVYEVISGPSIMEQVLEHWSLLGANQTWNLSWILRVKTNTSWVNASSPLEVFVQFTKNEDDDASVTFDIINAYVLDSLWEQYTSENNQDDPISQDKPIQLSAPLLFDVIIAVVFTSLVFRKHRTKPP